MGDVGVGVGVSGGTGVKVAGSNVGVGVTVGVSVCVGVGPRVDVGDVGGPARIKGIVAATIAATTTPVAPMSATTILISILLLLLYYSVALNMLNLALLCKGHFLEEVALPYYMGWEPPFLTQVIGLFPQS
jgi:hypothetical protein